MRGKWFIAALLAAAGVLAWSGPSRGGDTIRLNRTASAPTQRLVDDGQGADTVRVWHHGFGYGGWGYRGFGWGGYRGFGWGGLGYRGLGWGGYGLGYGGLGYGLGYGGFYRPYYGFGLGYRGLGYGLGWGGLGYGLGGLGYGGYGLGYGGFYPGLGIGYGGFFPCAGSTAGVYTLSMPAATLGTPLPTLAQPRPSEQPPSDGTFPYDGGPSNPVPSLKETPPSSTPAPRSVPLEGRSVSLPKTAPKWSYPAYGETARRIAPASERIYLTRGTSKTDSR
ncbi:MAG TPA: hypothetical protein VMG10_31705 [Gemmataceae bacterium]|nr:hypothetical protein [Gemmataceae bacterium]